jgi:hypothetical protein
MANQKVNHGIRSVELTPWVSAPAGRRFSAASMAS